MKRLLRALLLAFLPATLVLAATPAQAVIQDPYMTSPSGQVQSGYAGPLTFNFTNAPVDRYNVDLECGSTYLEWTAFDYDGVQNTFSWRVPAIKGPKTCEVSLYNDAGDVWVTDTFTVAAPPLPKVDVYDSSVSPATFYPLVRDGYRDSTKMRFRLNQKAHVTAVVTKNSTGNRVRRADLGTLGGGARSWTWNGRNNNRDTVRSGGYTIQITATNADGSRDTAARRVTVDTALITKRAEKGRWGDSGAASTSGSCYVNWDTYEGSADLDCWGGNYAQLTYNVRIPSDAFNVSWEVIGHKTSADLCCTGTITKTAERTSSTNVRVRAKATGLRAYRVRSVWVYYSYKKRI